METYQFLRNYFRSQGLFRRFGIDPYSFRPLLSSVMAMPGAMFKMHGGWMAIQHDEELNLYEISIMMKDSPPVLIAGIPLFHVYSTIIDNLY